MVLEDRWIRSRKHRTRGKRSNISSEIVTSDEHKRCGSWYFCKAILGEGLPATTKYASRCEVFCRGFLFYLAVWPGYPCVDWAATTTRLELKRKVQTLQREFKTKHVERRLWGDFGRVTDVMVVDHEIYQVCSTWRQVCVQDRLQCYGPRSQAFQNRCVTGRNQQFDRLGYSHRREDSGSESDMYIPPRQILLLPLQAQSHQTSRKPSTSAITSEIVLTVVLRNPMGECLLWPGIRQRQSSTG